jgi:hypothetical protein
MFDDFVNPSHPRFDSLAEARRAPGAVVILEGDWGGQIYLTAQARHLSCSHEALVQLLADLDSVAWESNRGEGTDLRFEERAVGSVILGGMGGGVVVDGVWMHEQFEELGLAPTVLQVLSGDRDRIAMPPRPTLAFDGAYRSIRSSTTVRFSEDGQLATGDGRLGRWELIPDDDDGLPLRLHLAQHTMKGILVEGILFLSLQDESGGTLAPGPCLVEFAFAG